MVASQELAPQIIPAVEIAPSLAALELENVTPQSLEDLGHAALTTEVQNPEQTQETTAGKYDYLTTPLVSNIGVLKRDLGLGDNPDSNSYLESIAWQAEQDRPNARVAVNIPINALPRFLTAGRYISATESGIGTSAQRADAEIKRGLRNMEEPPLVYGYLTTTDVSTVEQPEVFGYGGVIATLSTEATTRATFTSTDSMDMGITKDSLRNIDDALLIEEARRLAVQTNGEVGAKTRYVEAQVHEGLSIADLESISVPLGHNKLADTLQMLEESLPNADKTVRIDTTDALYEASQLLELAETYPKTKIELVVKPMQSAGDTVRNPELPQIIGNKDGTKTEVSSAHERMRERMTDLSDKLSVFAQQKGFGKISDNISIVSGIYDRSFNARTESHDPHGRLSRAA